ncbi:MAG TPA: hypothetical protein VIT44_12235 [Cyclobacteriaceae bacterium]
MENQLKKEFEAGQRVITPDGEGEVVSVSGDTIKVKLNSGTEKTYPADKLSDDSDAG